MCRGCGDGDYDEVIGVRQGIEQVDANWADQNQKQPPITLMILLTIITIILLNIILLTILTIILDTIMDLDHS